jgi:hypothetical protein
MTAPRIAGLMIFAAGTLVVASTLHLTGAVDDGRPPFRADRAGIAEAIIAAVLLSGALALLRGRWRITIGAIVFAIAGFGVGLSMTTRGGATGDIAYHATMLPILLFTLLAASRAQRSQQHQKIRMAGAGEAGRE